MFSFYTYQGIVYLCVMEWVITLQVKLFSKKNVVISGLAISYRLEKKGVGN